MKIIFDACAIIAFFRDETGTDIVEKSLCNEQYYCMIHIIR